MFRRLKVFFAGIGIGALFALIIAGPMMPSTWHLGLRAESWLGVMSGPIFGTKWGLDQYHTSIRVGWFAILLIPAIQSTLMQLQVAQLS